MEKVLAQSSSRLMSMPFFGDKKTRSVTGFTSFAITYKNGKISD
ncbi:hypothetical protein ACRRM7_001137 [Escherichia coli]